MQVVLPNVGRPPNETVSAANMPGGRRPCEARNGPVMGESHILEMFPHRLGIAQVMVLGNEGVKEFLKTTAADLSKADR